MNKRKAALPHAYNFADRPNPRFVEAINNGSHTAFQALYKRYCKWVAQLAYRFTCDGGGAEDALKGTCLYLLGKFPGLGIRCRLKTCLYPVVRRRSPMEFNRVAKTHNSETDQRLKQVTGNS